MKNFLTLLLSIAIAQSAGLIGSAFTAPQIQGWYGGLVKPDFNPPSWVFGPVWVTLYALMGIAAYFVWQKRKKKGANLALRFYIIQLVLNALWSFLFFGQQSPGWAFAEILILLAFIVLTLVTFWKLDKKAGLLLIPYLLWVAFASFLNYSIWQLNTKCVSDSKCQTPMEYLIQSNCPFGSACIDSKCVVVCPLAYHAFQCDTDEDCDCSERGERTIECRCSSGTCVSVEAEI